MDAVTRGSRRFPLVHGALTVVAAGTLLLGLAACQAPAPTPEPQTEVVRPAAVRPQQAEAHLTGDWMERLLDRSRQQRAERFAGMTADRVDRLWAAEKLSKIGRTLGCLNYVIVAAPRGVVRVACLSEGE